MTTEFNFAQQRGVAAAGTDDLTVVLPYPPLNSAGGHCKTHPHLTSFTVYVDLGPAYTGFGGTVNATGPYMFLAEAWLIHNRQRICLDKGAVLYDAKYNRCVIGFEGRIHYSENDSIQVFIKNIGAITAWWGASGTYDISSEPVNETNVIHRQHDDVTWIYQAARINTLTPAGPVALVTRISMNTGQIGRLISSRIQGTASAGATLLVAVQDEDSVSSTQLASVAAGASRTVSLPSIGTAATATSNTANTTELILVPGSYLAVTSSVALATENQSIYVAIELLNDPTLPVWDNTGSGGASVIAASTISVANTLQPIVRPRMIG